MLERLRRSAALLLCAALAACGTTPDYPPAPDGYYRVQTGDTLYRIAVNNGRSVADLARWNGIKDTSAIDAGQLVRIVPPAGATSSASSSRAAAARASASAISAGSKPAPKP
ncbi:MAG: LysM domain-containing protein, partial [Rhodocyclaceae bacterium]